MFKIKKDTSFGNCTKENSEKAPKKNIRIMICKE